MNRSPTPNRTPTQGRWRTALRPFLTYQFLSLFILFLGFMIWVIKHEELFRQFNVLYYRSSYRHETLIVEGTGERSFWRHRVPTVIGEIGGQQVEVNARALGYDPPWAFSRSAEQRAALRDSTFPAGSWLEVLRSSEAISVFAYADPEIVSKRVYGNLTWYAFLRTAFLWHAVLLVGVGLVVSRYRYWWYLLSYRWRLKAEIRRIESQTRRSGRRKSRRRLSR